MEWWRKMLLPLLTLCSGVTFHFRFRKSETHLPSRNPITPSLTKNPRLVAINIAAPKSIDNPKFSSSTTATSKINSNGRSNLHSSIKPMGPSKTPKNPNKPSASTAALKIESSIPARKIKDQWAVAWWIIPLSIVDVMSTQRRSIQLSVKGRLAMNRKPQDPSQPHDLSSWVWVSFKLKLVSHLSQVQAAKSRRKSGSMMFKKKKKKKKKKMDCCPGSVWDRRVSVGGKVLVVGGCGALGCLSPTLLPLRVGVRRILPMCYWPMMQCSLIGLKWA